MRNVSCSVCSYDKIKYKCKTCPKVGLCVDCFEEGLGDTIENHLSSHTMTVVENYNDDSDDNDDKNEDELDDYVDEDEDEDEEYDDDAWENNRKNNNHSNGGEDDDDDDDDDYYDEDDDASENYSEFFEEMDSTVNKIFQELNQSREGSSSHNHSGSGVTYGCPHCNQQFSEPFLIEHVLTTHSKEKKAVVCPICASQPGGDPNYYSKHFPSHLTLRHSSSLASSLMSSSNNPLSLGGFGGGGRNAKLTIDDINLLKNTDLLTTLFNNTSLSSVLGSLSNSGVGGTKQKDIESLYLDFKKRAINSSSGSTSTATPTTKLGGNVSFSNSIYKDSEDNKAEICTNNNINLKASHSNLNVNFNGNNNNSNNNNSNIENSNNNINGNNIDSISNIIDSGDSTKIKKPQLTLINQSHHSREDLDKKNSENILKGTFVRELLYDTIFF